MTNGEPFAKDLEPHHRVVGNFKKGIEKWK